MGDLHLHEAQYRQHLAHLADWSKTWFLRLSILKARMESQKIDQNCVFVCFAFILKNNPSTCIDCCDITDFVIYDLEIPLKCMLKT